VLASRQHVYGRNLRSCWFGTYHGILSEIDVYNNYRKVPQFWRCPYLSRTGKKKCCPLSTVIPIQQLFEAHIIVRDMQRSVAFYRDVLGLQVGIEQPERPAAFFWVGGHGKSMLGIFTLGSWPMQMMQHHLSFHVKLEDLLEAAQRLRSAGITPKGRRTPSYPRGEPTDEPIVFAWMPAASIIFDDPDGNLLEYIAMLPDPPRGIVRWSEWNAGYSARISSSGANTVTPVERLFEDHISDALDGGWRGVSSRAYYHATQQAFLEAHELAFHYFGGVFRRLRYDNLKHGELRISKKLRHYLFKLFVLIVFRLSMGRTRFPAMHWLCQALIFGRPEDDGNLSPSRRPSRQLQFQRANALRPRCQA